MTLITGPQTAASPPSGPHPVLAEEAPHAEGGRPSGALWCYLETLPLQPAEDSD